MVRERRPFGEAYADLLRLAGCCCYVGACSTVGEEFMPSDGSKCKCPGTSGVAAQDINCRCRASHDIMNDEEFFKATGRHFAEKRVDILRGSGIIETRRDETSHMAKSEEDDFWKGTKPIVNSKEDLAKARKYAEDKGINLILSNDFDGDIGLLNEQIDTIQRVASDFGLTKRMTIEIKRLQNGDFGELSGNTVVLGMQALRSKQVTEGFMNEDNYLASTSMIGIAAHEMGHVIAQKIGNKGIEIAQRAYLNLYGKDISTQGIIEYLMFNLSKYSVDLQASNRLKAQKKFKQSYYKEVLSEVLAKDYTNSDAFSAEFVRILKEEYL